MENSYCDYEQYEALLLLVDQRNKLSHVYNKDVYGEIHDSLEEAYSLMMSQFRLLI